MTLRRRPCCRLTESVPPLPGTFRGVFSTSPRQMELAAHRRSFTPVLLHTPQRKRHSPTSSSVTCSVQSSLATFRRRRHVAEIVAIFAALCTASAAGAASCYQHEDRQAAALCANRVVCERPPSTALTVLLTLSMILSLYKAYITIAIRLRYDYHTTMTKN